ncbi:hypothetical protein ACTHQN_12770 [Curtobacterium flaccumfaciens]
MLILVDDASTNFRSALDSLRADADEWEALSRSASFDEEPNNA